MGHPEPDSDDQPDLTFGNFDRRREGDAPRPHLRGVSERKPVSKAARSEWRTLKAQYEIGGMTDSQFRAKQKLIAERHGLAVADFDVHADASGIWESAWLRWGLIVGWIILAYQLFMHGSKSGNDAMLLIGGFMLLPIAVVVWYIFMTPGGFAASVGADQQREREAHVEATKKTCPDCISRVPNEARVCRHCQHRFE